MADTGRTVAIAALLGLASCQSRSCAGERKEPAVAAPGDGLAVPRWRRSGSRDDPGNDDWPRAGRAVLVDSSGAAARPHSEARFLWDEQHLHLLLYAADENIQTRVTRHDGPMLQDDAFSIELQAAGRSGPRWTIAISATGVVADAEQDGAKLRPEWESGIRVGVSRDGTLNDPRDRDEEWIVKAALPLRAIRVAGHAGSRIWIRISRCDTPLDGKRRCSAWGGQAAGLIAGVLELL